MATNWLTEREQRGWRGLQQIRTTLMPYLERQLAQESGLSAAEFEVLVAVSEAPGERIRSRDLGRQLGWERSRLSHQLSRMEKRGSVCRADCDEDARGFDVVLTGAGRQLIEAAAPGHVESVRHCFIDLLSPEQLDTLAEIGDTIAAHLDTEHDICPTAASESQHRPRSSAFEHS